MATDIIIPALGESITEAVIASWLKPDGAWVDRDEDIVELETDKVTMPLPAPAAGILKHSVEEGDTIEVGASIGTLDESAKKPEGASQKTTSSKAAKGATSAPAKEAATTATPSHAGGRNVLATPLARKLADEHQVDLTSVTPTGPGGRIREHDVVAALGTPSPPALSNGAAKHPAPPPMAPVDSTFSRGIRRERMSQLRQRIASRLVEAQHTAAMLTTFNECDMTAVMELRTRHKDEFLKKHGVKLGFMSFFAKAAASALQTFPQVNAFLVAGEKGPELEYHDYCDIAFAVGTDKGLVVPVLRNCESLGFAQIEQGLGELATKAREGTLTLEEMQGGTFTISNGGVYGSMMSTPILNPPQSGILGMHNIMRRAVEHPDKPGSGEVVIRPMMYLALSYDHRVVDGEGAVRFLRHIKDCIEHPERLLLSL
ncbi:MAG: 2-oxoglutarate dehydrogenase complex dihydrolipoyllysine-residue succinyltransferase [Phycisphaerales bacterium]|nr:2-oxoglutarate dehydrogenase complex dihydrolipoyllysine-residue succinyltransferase [Phycisphaerales bacterium]